VDNPTPETTGNINTALFLMASLSPRVKAMLDNESYRESAEQDEATDQYVLEKALQALYKDLQDIGVEFIDHDFSDVTEELAPLFDFIALVTYLLPSPLYSLIKTNEPIRTCLDHLVTGSLGNGETLIQTYLSELAGLNGQPALAPEITDIVDHYYSGVTQSEAFTDYLKNLHHLVTQERLTPETDPEQHGQYLAVIKEIIGRMSDVVNSLVYHVNYEELCSLQNSVIKDLASPANFSHYHYLFTTDPTTLPEGVKDLYGKANYHYRVSYPWCLDYYTLRKLKPTTPHVMMMYIFLYALYDKESDYLEATRALQQPYPQADVTSVINTLYRK
jgi:hypothetical protein